MEVWPENWPAFQLFVKMETQWYIGMNGRAGLNYLVARDFINRMKLNDAEHDELFDDIRTLERAALEAM